MGDRADSVKTVHLEDGDGSSRSTSETIGLDTKPWMATLKEERKKSFESMELRMAKIQKKIVELERIRDKSASLGQRRLLSRQIAQMEELCEEISENMLMSSLESQKAILELCREIKLGQQEIDRASESTTEADDQDNCILSWLTGSWETDTPPALLGSWPRNITIRKIGGDDGYYETTHTYLTANQRVIMWKADGVPRNNDCAILVDDKVFLRLPGQTVEYSKHATDDGDEDALCLVGTCDKAQFTGVYKRC